MFGAIIIIIFLYGITQPILSSLKEKNNSVNINLLNNLFWYHYVFWLIYYLYALFNPSDSKGYFQRSSTKYNDWFGIYETGTKFIDFVAYPLTSKLGFTYEMMMALFAWFGYLGFIYFYLFFKENLKFSHNFQGYNLITLLLFLPNMHFWTASLGKGSLIFLGIGMSAYGLSRIASRKIALILGLAIVYHVRPHLFLFIGLGIIFGLFSGRAKIPAYQKVLVFAGAFAAIFMLYNQILAFAMLDSDNVVESFESFSTQRGSELAKSGSGVNTASMPLPLKLLTFWFRPLFVDAPGALGLFVSVENLFYVILALKLFSKSFIKFIINGSTLIKASLVIFITSSIALSMVMGNLGIIIRQKSMVMYFFFFIILAFMDHKKMIAYQRKSGLLKKKPVIDTQQPVKIATA